MRAPVVNRA